MSKDKATTQSGSGRSSVHAAERNVLDFLRKCKAYEADSVRVIADVISSKDDAKADLTMVNRYLSDGYYKEDGMEYDKMVTHRTERALELTLKLTNFFDKEAYAKASHLVMALATNKTSIEQMRQNLQPRPVMQADAAQQQK